MSLGGGQTISPVAGSNKYAQIMELMRMRQPMNTQSYTGGFNAYTPASVSAAPSSYYEELLRQQQLASANRGGGRQERDPAEQARINAFMDAEDAKDVENGDPVGTTRAARIQSDLGPIASFLNPFSGIMALADAYKGFQDPRDTSDTSFGAEIGRTVGGWLNSGPGYSSAPNSRMSATGLANLNAMSNPTYSAGVGETYGSGSLGGFQAGDLSAMRDAMNAGGSSGYNGSTVSSSGMISGGLNQGPGYGGVSTSDGGGDSGGGNYGGDSGGYGGSYGSGSVGGFGGGDGGDGGGGYAKGGKVTMNRLRGPNPAGPDDGYAGLKSGEFVINKKSVNKYGIELMNAINAGKISKGKLRGLLEG